MKSIKNSILTLVCLLFFGPCFGEETPRQSPPRPVHAPTPAAWYQPKNYETGAQLLLGINAWLKKFNLPTLDYDEMCARLAEQASFADYYAGPAPLAVSFLKCLLKKRRFTDPVELDAVPVNDMPLSSDFSAGERLPLPPHYILEVHILTLPRGSRDRRGQAKVVNWYHLLVAYAMDRGEKHESIRP